MAMAGFRSLPAIWSYLPTALAANEAASQARELSHAAASSSGNSGAPSGGGRCATPLGAAARALPPWRAAWRAQQARRYMPGSSAYGGLRAAGVTAQLLAGGSRRRAGACARRAAAC